MSTEKHGDPHAGPDPHAGLCFCVVHVCVVSVGIIGIVMMTISSSSSSSM